MVYVKYVNNTCYGRGRNRTQGERGAKVAGFFFCSGCIGSVFADTATRRIAKITDFMVLDFSGRLDCGSAVQRVSE